jgi:hypothetical protein
MLGKIIMILLINFSKKMRMMLITFHQEMLKISILNPLPKKMIRKNGQVPLKIYLQKLNKKRIFSYHQNLYKKLFLVENMDVPSSLNVVALKN